MFVDEKIDSFRSTLGRRTLAAPHTVPRLPAVVACFSCGDLPRQLSVLSAAVFAATTLVYPLPQNLLFPSARRTTHLVPEYFFLTAATNTFL